MPRSIPSGARIAAWVALLAGAAVIAALVALVMRDVVALGEALAALAVVGAAGWFALTRRGVVRLLGIVVALAALAAGAVALVLRHAVDELVALAAALAVLQRRGLRGAARRGARSDREPASRRRAEGGSCC